jgi:hypothetical protein
MRYLAPRVAAASATFLALLGLSIGTAQGDGVIETIYVDPTTYVIPSTYVTTSSLVSTGATYVVPTSAAYVVPTSAAYVVPTGYSYVLPAAYETTAYTYLPTSASYYVPSAYTTSYYRRPGLLRRMFGRSVVETSRTYAYDVTPTVYYQPTTIRYDAPMVTTGLMVATACNESPVPFERPQPVNNGNGNGNGSAGNGSGGITSQPKYPQEPTYNESSSEKAKAATKDAAKEKAVASPPAVPADPDGAGGLTEPPKDMPKGAGDSQDRGAFRPRATELKARAAGASSLNVLRGEVVSGLLGKKEAGLQVVFSDLKGTYPDRVKTTDDVGAFEVFLPNGSWSIKVVDPKAVSGTKPKEYGEVTSTAGRYLDDQDSPIYSLRLNH